MRFLIIFIFLASNSFADEVIDIKNLFINSQVAKGSILCYDFILVTRAFRVSSRRQPCVKSLSKFEINPTTTSTQEGLGIQLGVHCCTQVSEGSHKKNLVFRKSNSKSKVSYILAGSWGWSRPIGLSIGHFF